MAYLTYFDAVESLIVSSFGGPQDAEQRDIRTAIHRAYDELTTIRDWSYYHVHGRIILQAPYDTGSVTSSGGTVTHAVACTGLASTDTLTCQGHGLANGAPVQFSSLTGGSGISTGVAYYVVSATPSTFQVAATPGGTAIPLATDITAGVFGAWPPWAASGAYLKVGEEVCRVASRTSPVTIVLDSALRLKADVTAQPFTLYRTVYPLPSDFRNLDEPSDEYNWWSGLYVTPDQAMKLERVRNSSGEPYHWTVIKDPDSSGWAIKVIGYPTGTQTLDFTYRRTARPIRYSGHEAALRQGTIARTGAAVTGSGTAFSASMVGSVLRVGDTTNVPGPIESLTPWVSEGKITAVGGATGLTTEGSGTIASTTKYLITDPIDIAPHMHAAMDSACDYWLARIRGTGEDKAFSMYQRDLRLAMEQDQLAPLSGRSREVWHDGGWRSPLRPDAG